MKSQFDKLREKINDGIILNQLKGGNSEKGKTIYNMLKAVLEDMDKIEKEELMIGKYGYFWDDIKNPVYYGKLDAIIYNNEYGEDVSYETNGMLPFTYFSLTHPEHLK
jgi:hypothetical protein